nr:MAG TPA: hypothetical protein [Caudoviricetes sp.]
MNDPTHLRRLPIRESPLLSFTRYELYRTLAVQ